MRQEVSPQVRQVRRQAGMTLLELIIACAILLVLASAAMPVARYTVKRQKEAELHRELREMRDAIDRYKDAADRNLIRVEAGTEGYPPDLDTLVKGVDLGSQQGAGIAGATTPGQPLVPATGFGATAPSTGFGGSSGGFGGAFGGVFGQTPGQTSRQSGSAGQDLIRHVRFLRRIPVDPMTGRAEWGMRSVQDDPDSTSWGGKDVFDVFSLSTSAALDGTKYSDW
jgi:prepilin-type N-terminal cleavage/methylation domain-containing protein